MLSLHQLEKTFPARAAAVHAFGPVSLDVAEGEFISLLGPSGCGKSTALYIIAGLEHASRGEVRIDGQTVTGPGPERGMVFQNYTLFPWLTVRENTRFSLQLARNADYTASPAAILSRHARADHLIELLGLEAFAHHHPRALSGGMKQRVAIARALVNRPRLLLMDEPFGALDAQTREELQDLMILLHRYERTTTLFVTHDIEEALFVSSRVVVFSKRPGRIIADLPVPFSSADRTPALKLEPAFIELKRELAGLLRHERSDDARRQELLHRLVAHPTPRPPSSLSL
jgi:NitT/TauT family transport system ATP-binding protein